VQPQTPKRRGLSPIFSNILLILIIVLGMSFAFAYLTGYVSDFQQGQGSAIMELIVVEDVWFRSATHINITLYNYGQVDVTVVSVYLDGLQVDFTGDSDGVLTLSLEEHGYLQVHPTQPLAKSTSYNIKVVTERGSAFEGKYTAPAIDPSDWWYP
jgi:flagellin-like protein